MDKNIKKIIDSINLPEEGINLKELEKQVAKKLLTQAHEARDANSESCKLVGMQRTTFVERCRRLGIK